MKRSAAVAVIFLGAFLWIGNACGESPKVTDLNEGFFLPTGRAEPGRAAFEKFKCYSCHVLSSGGNFPAPTADHLGPILGAFQASQPPGRIAASIIVPSHKIKPGFGEPVAGGVTSPMGNFAETMTVQEMVDIVAYIRSLGMPADGTGQR